MTSQAPRFGPVPSRQPSMTNPVQAMLYAAGVPDKEAMKNAPQVGIASVWWEGNPCNMHLLDLGKEVKKAVLNQGMLGWQYNTVGVSDGITMGTEGRPFPDGYGTVSDTV